MANRDDYRGYGGGDRGRDRWRQDDDQRQTGGRPGGPERRSFGDQGRFNSDQARYGEGWRGGSGEGEREPWRRDRYGSRFDQDRAGYGSGYDREGGGYGRGQGGGYGGQEFGMEAGGRRETRQRDSGRREFEQWRPHGGAPYGDLELNARTSGVEEFGAPHDYAYHPPQGHEFEPDYVNWREEQLRMHDRDYQEWRRHQHQQLDDEYRKFRTERRDTFGKHFHEWRSQRNMSTGMGRQDVAPGMDGQHRMADGFGGGGDMPSGRLESPAARTGSPSAGQSGSQPVGHGVGAQGSGTAGGSEFGNTPPQVQAASDGGDTRRDAEDRKDGDKGHEPKH